MSRTAHGGQLARSVGSPVVFVALTATPQKDISNNARIEDMMRPRCEYNWCQKILFRLLLCEGCRDGRLHFSDAPLQLFMNSDSPHDFNDVYSIHPYYAPHSRSEG